MSRTNRILSILLAIQLVVAVAIFLPRVFPAGAESAPLFGPIEATDITALSVQDMDGNRVELKKQGETWVVSSNGDYPADGAKVDAFLAKLVGLTTNPLVTRTSGSHARLQVAEDEFARRVGFTLADGGARTLFIGASGSGGGSHVRDGSRDEVYLSSDLSSFDAAASVINWVDAVYFQVTQESLTGVTLENANGAFEFAKDDAGNWTMPGLASGETFDADGFTALVARLASLRMTAPLGQEEKPEYGFADPSAVITLSATGDVTGTLKTYTLTIGAKETTEGEDALSTYVVKSSESEYYARVNGFSVEDFVTRTRDGFLKPPATPTPELTATVEVTATLPVTSTLEATPKPTP